MLRVIVSLVVLILLAVVVAIGLMATQPLRAQGNREFDRWTVESGNPVPGEFCYAAFLTNDDVYPQLSSRVFIVTHDEVQSPSPHVILYTKQGDGVEANWSHISFVVDSNSVPAAIVELEKAIKSWGDETDMTTISLDYTPAPAAEITVRLKILLSRGGYELYEYAVVKDTLVPSRWAALRGNN